MGGGGGDWVYTAERMHYDSTKDFRWVGGPWSKAFKDVRSVVWIGKKQDGILPKVPEGVFEAACFDEDAILEEDGETIYICTYSYGVWNKGVPFAGIPQPFRRRV